MTTVVYVGVICSHELFNNKQALKASNMIFNILSRRIYREHGKQMRLFYRIATTTSDVLQKKFKTLSGCVQEPLLKSSQQRFASECSDAPEITIVCYEEVKNLLNQPEVLLIDVRQPIELRQTGKIPTCINIPLANLKRELALERNADEFKKKYGRNKPCATTRLIFSCRSGIRALYAGKTAVALGYSQVMVYKGSWNDWSKHDF